MKKLKLTRESLLKASELKTEIVTINGAEAVAQELCSTEYISTLEDPSVKKENGEYDSAKLNSLLITRCIVDDEGNRLLTDADAELLRKRSFSVYAVLIGAVNRVNGLSAAEAKN